MENFEKPNELENPQKNQEEISRDTEENEIKNKKIRWTENLAREKIAAIYTEWLVSAKDGDTFGQDMIIQKNAAMYQWIKKNKISIESLLPSEALSRWELKRIIWTEDLARQELSKIYYDWLTHAKEEDVFRPSIIKQENDKLYQWFSREKKPIEPLLPQEALSRWEARVNWTKDSVKQELARIYTEWLSQAKEGDIFSMKEIKRERSRLDAWFRHNQISIESLLPTEALTRWKFQRKTKWTEDLARENLSEIYDEWKVHVKEGDVFGLGTIRQQNENLSQWLTKNDISIEPLLPAEARIHWHAREQVRWNNDIARETLSKIYTEWLIAAKGGETFGPKLIIQKNKNLYSWIKKNKIPVESLLSPEMLSRWETKRIILTKDIAREELAKLYTEWLTEAKEGDVIGPYIISQRNITLYNWLRKNEIPFESLMSPEMLSHWWTNVNWTESLAREELLKIYAEWVTNAKAGDTFSPSLLISKKGKGLYQWLRKNKVPLESLLPPEAQPYLKIKLTENLARQELSRIYYDWKNQPRKEETFGPTFIRQKNGYLYYWLDKNKISIETLLPQEAVNHYRSFYKDTTDISDAPENWLSTDKISESTGISKEEIERIAKKLRQKYPDKFGKFKNKDKE